MWLLLLALPLAIAVWTVVDQRDTPLDGGSRLAALTGAVLALVLGTWVSAFALISTSALQSPNPDPNLDGDPCCGHPDTWTDVIVGGVYCVVIGFVALTVLAGSALLAAGAIHGRFPAVLSGQAIRRLAAAAALGAIAVPASWVMQSLLIS